MGLYLCQPDANSVVFCLQVQFGAASYGVLQLYKQQQCIDVIREIMQSDWGKCQLDDVCTVKPSRVDR